MIWNIFFSKCFPKILIWIFMRGHPFKKEFFLVFFIFIHIYELKYFLILHFFLFSAILTLCDTYLPFLWDTLYMQALKYTLHFSFQLELLQLWSRKQIATLESITFPQRAQINRKYLWIVKLRLRRQGLKARTFLCEVRFVWRNFLLVH